jgi:tellurite methyltransferase
MRREISDFYQDEQGDWVAHLACLHAQHVRHRPPFWDRPWVHDEQGRAEHLGTELECPLCDRAELPDGLVVVRTAGPFDRDTIPKALCTEHRVAHGTWARLRVLEGGVGFVMATDPPIERQLVSDDFQAIPPDVPHRVIIDGPAVVAIDFLTERPASPAEGQPES